MYAAFLVNKNASILAVAVSKKNSVASVQITNEKVHKPKKKRLHWFDKITPAHAALFSILSIILGSFSFVFFSSAWASIPNVGATFAFACIMALSGLILGNLAMNADDHIVAGIGFVGAVISSLFLVIILGALIFAFVFHHLLGV